MGSKLTRQRSLDFETKVSKRRRQRNDSPGESERSGDFLFTSLMLKSDKLPGMLRRTNHCPYVRRVAWIREIQRLLREQKMEQAGEVLKLLRKDLGLQGSSLNDILYKNASFLNLVDPISHELLLSLARDLQCPKRDLQVCESTCLGCFILGSVGSVGRNPAVIRPRSTGQGATVNSREDCGALALTMRAL
ncbi:hypothetical protein NQZ68_010035 [Dissostichus eleginoides]|nr:hypothetical protein NQZ68_010035 [Dissostichus eleginoides]